MKNEIQCLDLVTRKVSNDPTPQVCSLHNDVPTPHVLSPEMVNSAPVEPPLANIQTDVNEVVLVPDAQSVPNVAGIFHDASMSAQNIPMSQDHRSKSFC